MLHALGDRANAAKAEDVNYFIAWQRLERGNWYNEDAFDGLGDSQSCSTRRSLRLTGRTSTQREQIELRPKCHEECFSLPHRTGLIVAARTAVAGRAARDGSRTGVTACSERSNAGNLDCVLPNTM